MSGEQRCWRRTVPSGSSTGWGIPKLTEATSFLLLWHGGAAAWYVSSAQPTVLNFGRAILATYISVLKNWNLSLWAASAAEVTQAHIRWDLSDYFRSCPRCLNLIFWYTCFNFSTAYLQKAPEVPTLQVGVPIWSGESCIWWKECKVLTYEMCIGFRTWDRPFSWWKQVMGKSTISTLTFEKALAAAACCLLPIIEVLNLGEWLMLEPEVVQLCTKWKGFRLKTEITRSLCRF